MRRSEREVRDREKICTIIAQCHCCRLGLVENNIAYIVPLNFGYVYEKEKHIFYFHSALEGRKIRLLQENPYASFEMDTHYRLLKHEIPCEYSAQYQSIIGYGKVRFLHTVEEKMHGLRSIMLHNTKSDAHAFPIDMLERVAVFCLTVGELSCKEHL